MKCTLLPPAWQTIVYYATMENKCFSRVARGFFPIGAQLWENIHFPRCTIYYSLIPGQKIRFWGSGAKQQK